MKTWTATEARAKFYEVIRRAESGEPEEITRGKQTFYLIRYEDWLSLEQGTVPPALHGMPERKNPAGNAGLRPSADDIAEMAEEGEDISAFFRSKGKMMKGLS